VLTKRPKRLARMLADPGFVTEVAQHATDLIASRPWQRWQLDLGDKRLAGDSGLGGGWTVSRAADGNNVWSPPWPLPNVWVGTSIENDDYAWRADYLRQAQASTRFLSLEPLLGPLPSLDLTGVDWVIVGGESGPQGRPMDLDWIRDLVTRARDVSTAVFIKQFGTRWAKSGGYRGKGTKPSQWPADLRIRELPSSVGPVDNHWRNEPPRRASG
jgi:hypothetical protein